MAIRHLIAIRLHARAQDSPCTAYRISCVAFRSAIDRSAGLRDRCLRYVETLVIQASQLAAQRAAQFFLSDWHGGC